MSKTADAVEKWWQSNKADVVKQVDGVLADNKFRLLAKEKSASEFVEALEARGVPAHIAHIARELF